MIVPLPHLIHLFCPFVRTIVDFITVHLFRTIIIAPQIHRRDNLGLSKAIAFVPLLSIYDTFVIFSKHFDNLTQNTIVRRSMMHQVAW